MSKTLLRSSASLGRDGAVLVDRFVPEATVDAVNAESFAGRTPPSEPGYTAQLERRRQNQIAAGNRRVVLATIDAATFIGWGILLLGALLFFVWRVAVLTLPAHALLRSELALRSVGLVELVPDLLSKDAADNLEALARRCGARGGGAGHSGL